jgi:hypothetical protein
MITHQPPEGKQGAAAHFMEDRAYELIIAGWEIFPCRGKAPWISKKDGGNGHLDATLDDRQVEEWWTKYPTANIGGRPAEWMIVIDLDPRSGGTFEKLTEVAGEIPPTLHSFSGRGDGGMHLIFNRNGLGETTTQRLPDGIDVKDHSGYIILPPSVHPDTRKPYRWGTRHEIATLPNGLRELLAFEPQPRTLPTTQPSFKVTNKRLAGLLHKVSTAVEGSRNDLLNKCAHLAATELGLGNDPAARDLFVEAARQAGLRERDITPTLRSAGFRS